MKPSRILSAGMVLVLAFGLAGCEEVFPKAYERYGACLSFWSRRLRYGSEKRRNESTCHSGGQSGKCRNDSVKTSWVQRER